MQSFEWAIEDVVAAYPALSLDHAMAMAVALMRRVGQPCRFLVRVLGFELDVLDGEREFELHVAWSQETEAMAQRMERTEQRTPMVERAAIVTALLFAHLMPESAMDFMKQAGRADYVLPEIHEVVEISGTEDVREMPRRGRMKRRQVLENLLGWNGHVVICCFDVDQLAIEWTYCEQEE